MKTLSVEDRLEYARAAVAVIRAIKTAKKQIRYHELGRAIGLIANQEAWKPWHQQQVKAILIVAAAVERQGLGGRDNAAERLEFQWIVDKNGKPGAGFAKQSKIVTQ